MKKQFSQLGLSQEMEERVLILPFIDRMDYAYSSADLVLCRSGAITCSELIITGTPSILVPSRAGCYL